MCEARFLVPPRWKRLVCSDLDLQTIRVSRSADGGERDYGVAALSLAARDPAVLEAIVRESGPLIRGLSTICFCVDVAHGEALTQALVDAGHNAAFICADTPKEERKRLIKAFRKREIDILVNVNVLSEGFDCPHVGCIIMAAPTTSVVRFVQRLGRGLRAHPGKTECLIIDLMPLRPDARQVTLDDVVPQPVPENELVEDGAAILDGEDDAEQTERKKAEPRLTFLDPSTPSQFDWAEVANKTWSTAAGFDEAAWIIPHHTKPDRYRAFVEDRYQKLPWGAGTLIQISKVPEPLDQCLKTADEWLRDNGELSFMRKAGHWRYEPITEKQRTILVKFMSVAEVDMIERGDQPKGEAGDRITPYYARQRAQYITGFARKIADDG